MAPQALMPSSRRLPVTPFDAQPRARPKSVLATANANIDSWRRNTVIDVSPSLYLPPSKSPAKPVHRVKRKPLPALLPPQSDLQRLPLLMHIEFDVESNPTFSSVLQFPLPPAKPVALEPPGDAIAQSPRPASTSGEPPSDDFAAFHIWSSYAEPPASPASPSSTASHSPSHSLSSISTGISRGTSFDSSAPRSPTSSLSSLATTIGSASSLSSRKGPGTSDPASPTARVASAWASTASTLARPTRVWHRGKMLFITPTSGKNSRRTEAGPGDTEDVLEIVAR